MSAQLKTMNTKLTTIEKDVKQNTDAIEGIKQDQTEVDNKVKNLEKGHLDLKNSNKQNQEGAARLVLNELREQDSRKDNIIIQNIPESEENDFDDRKKEDIENVEKLFKILDLDLDEENIKFLKRLGKKDENNPTRPLLIGFKNSEEKEKVLGKAINLKNEEEPWCEVYISPDLTLQQRKEDERIRTQVDMKNAEMSEEEALNFKYVVTGKKGQRRMVKINLENLPNRQAAHSTRGRGGGQGGRGRGRGRGRGTNRN